MTSPLRRLLLWMVSLLAVGATQCAVAAEPAAQPALIVGVTWPEAGNVSIENSAAINRFESELAVALARTQGRRVTFRLGALDLLMHELAEGSIDFIPGLARTPDRLDRLDFSVPHSRMNTNIFVRKGDKRIATADDLKDRRIIVIRESYSHAWCMRQGYATRLITVSDLTEGIRRLASGEGDCLLAKQINIFAAMQSAGVKNIEVRGPPIPELIQDLCIAVRAGNRDLLASLNEGLFNLKQTGELDRIYEKWLGLLEPANGILARNLRYISFGAALCLVLAAVTWMAYQVKLRRTRARLTEIERCVLERTEELAAAKARYEAVVASTPAAIVLFDPQDPQVLGRIVDCNDTACQLHGYTKNELIGESINRLRVEPHTRERFAAILAELKSVHRRHGHCQHRCKDGSIREIEFFSTLIHLDGRDLLLAVDLDITDRIRTETALRRTEEFQRLVLQAANDGIFDWDIPADRFSLSAHGWQLLGFAQNELPGHRLAWWQRLHPDEVAAAELLLARHLAEDIPFLHTARFLHKDGSVRWLYCRAATLRDAAGKPQRMVGSYTDITELKRIDEELQLTRRLRAIGELVGGIAHEFNNLLTPILLQTSLLATKESGSPETVAQLNSVLEAARRAQVLTRQLLQLGRQQNSEPTPHSLASIVDGTLSLVRSTIDRRIEIIAEYEPGLLPVRLNSVTMGQVVLNLVLNSRDALLEKLSTTPANWHPQLTLTLASFTGAFRGMDNATLAPLPQLWQRLSVTDNGPGIPAEIRERIFEPFFTTKAIGQGTGLGLAMVWHTVEELGGWVDVESVLSQGTQFHIYLPATAAPAQTAAIMDPRPPSPPTLPEHRLLLVEDDDLVGNTISTMLRRFGQNVTWVRSGEEALSSLQETPVVFDALLTDLNMPGLGGEALIARVKTTGFKGKMIVLSGNITPEAAQRLHANGVSALVQKPFEFERIKTLLAEL